MKVQDSHYQPPPSFGRLGASPGLCCHGEFSITSVTITNNLNSFQPWNPLLRTVEPLSSLLTTLTPRRFAFSPLLWALVLTRSLFASKTRTAIPLASRKSASSMRLATLLAGPARLSALTSRMAPSRRAKTLLSLTLKSRMMTTLLCPSSPCLMQVRTSVPSTLTACISKKHWGREISLICFFSKLAELQLN